MTPETDHPVLDKNCRELLLQLGAVTAAVPAEELTPQRRRQLMRDAIALYAPTQRHAQVQREDQEVPLPGRNLPARLYRPGVGQPATGANDVLLVFFHGGGWVIGDLDTHEDSCTFLTQQLGCTLLSVEYRKAPEHPFPAPCDDAAEAYAWAAQQASAWRCKRLAVAGDSAGAHLAAHAMFSNTQLTTAAALLFYPVTDIDFDTPSYRERGSGPGLTRENMMLFWQWLAGGATTIADDVRAVLTLQRWQTRPPPTVLSLAWHDPLHDEGIAYADLLRAAGGDVRLQVARDMPHGFLRHFGINPVARRHVTDATDALLAVLRPAA